MSTIQHCRSCRETELRTVIDFGDSPLADRLLHEHELEEDDLFFPLRLVVCPACALVQITENVPPEILYCGDYPYYTSISPGLVKHFTDAAHAMLERTPLAPGALVIEAASNDGYQLKVFRAAGLEVLGVDPAPGPAQVANDAGIDTRCEFFTAEVAQRLVAQGKRADLITGNNVLNLIQDLDDFSRAVDLLLKPGGTLCLEVPCFVDTIDQTAFDNVFHQNTTYWTATSLDRYWRSSGLFLNHVEPAPTFGGSLRVYFEHVEDRSDAVRDLLAEEQRRGVPTTAFYEAFAGRVEDIKTSLRTQIEGLHKLGKRLVAYGAAGGMATTLLSYLGLDGSDLDYAVDINPHKHGRYTSGSRLQIRPAEVLSQDLPDVALLLAWNFAEEVLSQQDDYRVKGGQFLVPIPEPRLV
ncbi:MAG: class I SAM-dependent methyltransferase [Planctomycetota bacterium]|nr:class I SAM-dependent methyltransferase [Planctomycetota bacterium]